MKKRLNSSDVANSSVNIVPLGVVIAFTTPCPSSRWSRYARSNGRVIVGATEGAEFINEFRQGENRVNLSLYKSGQHGGAEDVTLIATQMPRHFHAYDDIYYSEIAQWKPTGAKQLNILGGVGHKGKKDLGNVGWATTRNTSATPSGNAHPNMPPYIALYFCKKN